MAIRRLVLILSIPILLIGCVAESDRIKITSDPEIKLLKDYQEVEVSDFRDTKIQITEGDLVILVALYPKGFLYPVKGKIGEKGESFDALDMDTGDFHKAGSSDRLWSGIDRKTKPVRTGVFIFKDGDLDTILSDLTRFSVYDPESKTISLSLAILHMRKSETLLTEGSTDEALRTIDKAIFYFEATDRRLYAASISRLHKLKATLYKIAGDFEEFNDSAERSFESLMVASRYYDELRSSTYAYLQTMTQEERLILLTKTTYFNRTHWHDADDPRWGHDFDNLADAYGYIAVYYSEVGDLRMSLSYAHRAIEEARKNGNEDLIARAHRYLGIRHIRFGFWALAEDSILSSLDRVRSIYNRWMTLYALAFVHIQQGRFYSARRLLNKLAAQTPDRAVGRPINVSRLRTRLYMATREYEKAIPILESLYSRLDFWAEYGGGYKTSFIAAGIDLCRCYMETNRLQDAHAMIRRIESDLDSLGSPIELKLQAMLVKSEIAKRLGDDPAVLLKEAVSSLEEIRPTAGSAFDYEYWERMLHVYDTAVEALYDRGDLVEALEIAERARSRRFLDYLGSKKLGAKGPAGYMFSQDADGILESLTILENDLLEAAEKGGMKVRSVYEEGTRYTKRLGKYRNALMKAAEADRQFGVTYDVIPLSPREIQKDIPGDVTLVEYYLSDSALYIWVITRENTHGAKQDVSRDEMVNLVVAFRNSIFVATANRGIAISVEKPEGFPGEGERLNELLVSPIEKYIRTNRIAIIPYGILNYLPFQALHDGNQYLIEKYALSYIPSLSVLEFLGEGARRDSLSIIAFGNPDLNDEALDLPAAEKEVETIRAMYPSAKILTREQATESSAKSLAHRYDIIHFASHGEFLSQAPLASCIRLRPGGGDDGRLEAGEIFDIDIDADLVVTSACQSAIGQIGKGDEIVGLTRAFIYAGAKSVLGSLWNISDEATAILMKEFYSNISRLDKSEALRQAQLKMIDSRAKYSHPFYWAAFNVTGGV